MQMSLVIPCHNEAKNVEPFIMRVRDCMNEPIAPKTLELVFVDDGSTDNTFEILSQQIATPATNNISIKAIELSRNFGKEAALLAGLQNAKGKLIGFIDADLQQDPSISFEMFDYLVNHPETDCVAAVQENRQESTILKRFKQMFYKVFNTVGDVELPAHVSDFRVFRQNVASALMSMPEYFRFSKGLFAWVGFRTHIISYSPNARHAGKTSWSFSQLMEYAFGGIMSFTTWPLRLVFYLGFLTSAISVVYLLFILFEYFVVGVSVPGYPTLVCLIVLFFGIAMLSLGIFGEYLGRIYIEGKRRPVYITRQIAEQQPANEVDES